MRISDWSSDVCSSDLGQAGGRNAAAAPVDAFVVGQRAAYGDHGMNRVFVDILDHQHNPAVVQQKLVAGMAIFDQAGVVDADDGFIAFVGGVQVGQRESLSHLLGNFGVLKDRKSVV